MYSIESRIRYSETDHNKKLTIPALLDYFQDVCTFQSEDLGVGLSYLMPKNAAWILNTWHVEINRLPEMGEYVTVYTFPYEFRKFLGRRNFILKTREGEVLAIADTLWTCLDFEHNRPMRVTDEMMAAYVLGEPLEIREVSRKIDLPEAGNAGTEIMISRHHLDTNNHVNNAQYVKMALEYLPDGLDIASLRVEYKSQAHLGDIINPMIYQDQNRYVISLNRLDGEPYAVIEAAKR